MNATSAATRTAVHFAANRGLSPRRGADVAGLSFQSTPSTPRIGRFVGSRELERGRDWTTALNKGRAWVDSMPGGKRSSEKASR